MEENISGRLHFEWKDIEYEQAVHACLMSSLDVKIERVMVFTPQTNSCIQVYEVIIKLAWKHFNVIYTSIFLCMCLYVLLQMWNLRKNGHIAKEKYWNSTSRQTILGKLHPVGVAVWVALKSMYKSEVWKRMCSFGTNSSLRAHYSALNTAMLYCTLQEWLFLSSHKWKYVFTLMVHKVLLPTGHKND